MSDVTLYTPRGVRDLLPEAARDKVYLEGRLYEHFSRWGYDPVVTPTFELFDVLRLGQGFGAEQKMYRFVDREGSIIALRPEMTVPIARLVTSRLQDAPQPLRLQYIGSVFRYDEPQAGRLREFTQAGLELIGAEGPEADAEIIATTITAMVDLGLTGFRMDLGHVGFTSSVLDSLRLSPEATGAVRRSLLQQDYVALDRILTEAEAPSATREAIHALIALRGDASILDEAKMLARTEAGEKALENVSAVYRHLEAHGVAGWVRLDLGMLKQLDYYTGMVIEGYTSELGYALCSGGRYDNLLRRFGWDRPATGLAIGVERLLLALSRSGVKPVHGNKRVLFVANEARWAEACSAAWRLRTRGYTVEHDVLGRTVEEAVSYARQKGCSGVAVFAGSPSTPVEWITGDHREYVDVNELLERGGGLR